MWKKDTLLSMVILYQSNFACCMLPSVLLSPLHQRASARACFVLPSFRSLTPHEKFAFLYFLTPPGKYVPQAKLFSCHFFTFHSSHLGPHRFLCTYIIGDIDALPPFQSPSMPFRPRPPKLSCGTDEPSFPGPTPPPRGGGITVVLAVNSPSWSSFIFRGRHPSSVQTNALGLTQ